MKKHWNEYNTWNEAESTWDKESERLKKEHPLKVLKTLPSIPGIQEETAKNLKWKSLKWMVAKDEKFSILRSTLRHPFRHLFNYIKSLCKGKPYTRDGDFFLYSVKSTESFKKLLEDPNAIFVIGFSYCEKPHECPSLRFTSDCIRDPNHPVCRQCFIGKVLNALPEERTFPLIIPTIHYIGNKIFEIKKANPKKRLLFLITACELTLEMFGDWGNMAGVEGIGVRLDGRICNTMKAFELSERGIKPGLTVVVEATEKRILDIVSHWRTVVKA